jgi:RNA polymerase sigma-70 factor (ECF subfamily)
MVSPSDGEVQEIPISDKSPSPPEEAVRSEFTGELREALDELPEVYKRAILMCDVEGLSYSEIAERQSTTIGTVRSRIHRGRKLLREIVQKRGIRPPSYK